MLCYICEMNTSVIISLHQNISGLYDQALHSHFMQQGSLAGAHWTVYHSQLDKSLITHHKKLQYFYYHVLFCDFVIAAVSSHTSPYITETKAQPQARCTFLGLSYGNQVICVSIPVCLAFHHRESILWPK